LRVELHSQQPDGTKNWAELRDQPRPLDYVAAGEAVEVLIEYGADGSQTRQAYKGGADERMVMIMLGRAITAWSFPGVPVPSQNIAKIEDTLDSVFTDPDDWDLVCAAVKPLIDRITRRTTPKPGTMP
jgi:hypothetical protein